MEYLHSREHVVREHARAHTILGHLCAKTSGIRSSNIEITPEYHLNSVVIHIAHWRVARCSGRVVELGAW
jgi:hypothetical protein